jgi:hypothetical protein
MSSKAKFENDMTEVDSEKKGRKKGSIKIKLNREEETEENSTDENVIIKSSYTEEKPAKKSFFLRNPFARKPKDNSEVKAQNKITEINLENKKEPISASKKIVVDYSKDAPEEIKEDKSDAEGLHLNLKLAKEITSENSQNETNQEIEKKELEAAVNNGDLKLNQLGLSKNVNKKLKKSGFKTLNDIIEAGPESLADEIGLSEEEMIEVAKTIKSLTE